MNISIAHIQGGEVSGSIDESARHAISKFAHLHFPSTERAASYLVRMGEDPRYVHNVGCPSGDYIRTLDASIPSDFIRRRGVGPSFDIDGPFLLVIYHPVTTAFGTERKNVDELLGALESIHLPTLWIWPNIDAGSDDISKGLRVWREHHSNDWLHLIKNLEPIAFQKCLKRAACAVGNSSSFVRDSTFSGTPIVLIGTRQIGREYGENLMSVSPDREQIIAAVKSQLTRGRYSPSSLYGAGDASAKIVEKLSQFQPYRQKVLHYVSDSSSAEYSHEN